jgi:hypothetical protein
VAVRAKCGWVGIEILNVGFWCGMQKIQIWKKVMADTANTLPYNGTSNKHLKKFNRHKYSNIVNTKIYFAYFGN